MINIIILVLELLTSSIAASAAECIDTNDNCSFWAGQGECQSDPGFMNSNCPVSCGTCIEMADKDLVLIESSANYGMKQVVQGGYSARIIDVIRQSNQYMQNDVQNLSPQVIAECRNNEEMCAFWAALGECSNNPEFMSQQCGPSCRNCGQPVCPPSGTIPAFQPGELYDVFERIVANAPGNNTEMNVEEGITNYTVQLISKPERKTMDPMVEMQQHPWILSFDNFLTDEECEKLIELGYMVGYTRSHDTSEIKADGSYEPIQNDGRTPSCAFCSYPANCRSDDVVQRIHDRIAKVTGIPAGNSEDLPILKYNPGNQHGLHHDYVDQQLWHQCGPRILTFFLYLNDVEDGGDTSFPYLGISVKPKKGKALLWPSVLSSDLKQKDTRTAQEAKPVLKGKKYGAYSWLHLYEYIDLPCGLSLPYD